MDHTRRTPDRTSAILDALIRDQAIMAEAERLLSGRTREIWLKGRLASAYRNRMWRQNAQIIRSWMIWVIVIDVVTLTLNALLLPLPVVLSMIAPAAAIIPAALGVALVWLKPRSPAVLDAALLTGMLVILLSVSAMGVAAGPELLERHLHIMLFVAITGIIIFDIPFRRTVAIAALALGLYLLFQSGVGDGEIRTTLSGFIFFSIGVGATVMARRTMTILAQKSFLLELRDRRRMIDLSESNRQLEQLSRIDSLTGLANRHWLHERMEALWRRVLVLRQVHAGGVLIDLFYQATAGLY